MEKMVCGACGRPVSRATDGGRFPNLWMHNDREDGMRCTGRGTLKPVSREQFEARKKVAKP